MNLFEKIDLTRKHTGETGPSVIAESTEHAEPQKTNFARDVMKRLAEARASAPVTESVSLKAFPISN